MNRVRAWMMISLWAAIWVCPSFPARAEVNLMTPGGYLPGIPFLVKVEVRGSSGARDWGVWNGDAVLTADPLGVILSTNRIALRNGMGTALMTVSGTADFSLKAVVGEQQTVRTVTHLGGQPVTEASGTLSGASTTWSGLVRITGPVAVPAGHTLTIRPSTLILIDGVARGTGGISIDVMGSIQSDGTEQQPVVITSADAALNWGQIRHVNAEPSVYRHTWISKAGRAPGEGHTSTGPAIRAANSILNFDHCVVSDLTAEGGTIGKIMQANGSALTFTDCVLARARMGPEIQGTSMTCRDSYFLEMTGPDDADGIYLHSAGGRSLTMSGCVLAMGDDDAIDTLDANVLIENCIIRDWSNPNEDAKGVSAFNGDVELRRCLIANCFVGASSKSSGALAVLHLDHCTISSLQHGVSAVSKSNASAGNINIYLANSIVQSADALYSDFGSDRFVSVSYCNLTEPWPGAGNMTVDPLFIDPGAGDFRLQPSSRCIDAGDPLFSLDPDGTRTEMGYYWAPRRDLPPPRVVNMGVVINEIMYHPSSENPLEEYIELRNHGNTPVDLTGWQFSDGVAFRFPSVILPADGYLVVASDLETFRRKYPGVANVIGNWTGLLRNDREDIDLDDAQGRRVDSVRYADQGDWATRRRSLLDRQNRGWIWFAEHDGRGRSLELINPSVSNDTGQNWASSLVMQGTPGAANSVLATDIAPLIEEAGHFPIVPTSNDPVRVTARVSDESGNSIVTLHYRNNTASPPPFTSIAMRDDGINGDASSGDGIYTAFVPARANHAVVEFYIAARDVSGNARTWPAPAIAAEDGAGPAGQVVNALFQVDDASSSGLQPLYKIIMTEAERAQLARIPSQSNVNGPNSQMNATFVSIDGTGSSLRYLAGVRNRGHGSRTANPPNYRVNFRSDDPWKGVTGLNLNARQVYMQHFGSWLANRSGAIGTYAQAVQVRVNNANRATTGPSMFGSYAALEVYDSAWAARHFPLDGDGNIYKVARDIRPPNFNYRRSNPNSYTNTYFKETNVSENDFTDLIGMLEIMGENSGALLTMENIRRVINLEQWLTHLAVMNLMANGESGLNTGNNDDYYMYRGLADARFVLMFHDLDQILGQSGSLAANLDIFRSTYGPISGDSEGVWRAMARFLRLPEVESLYYATLQRLLNTTFSKPQFDQLIGQLLGSYVPQGTMNAVKSWMDTRRNYVQSVLPRIIPTAESPVAVLRGMPRSPTPLSSARLSVDGAGIAYYRYRLNNGPYGAETPVDAPIELAGLVPGTNSLLVIGRNAAGVWQSESDATETLWVVNPAWPSVRLNEVLAQNDAAVQLGASFPDLVELYNEGRTAINLSGMRLSDRAGSPNKFIFSEGATLAAGAYLVLDANQLGFNLAQSGDGLFLYDSAANGGALLDSVVFGFQAPDRSIGRLESSGEWMLTEPTFGSPNRVHPLGNGQQVKINEWLTLGISPYPDDFIELYNQDQLPVAIGGFYLTDQPSGAPYRDQIAALSFIAPRGYVTLVSGNGNVASEIRFSLASEQGEIALFANDQTLVDTVLYGPQSIGVSSGRCPDGTANVTALTTPTPGGPNLCPVTPPPPQTLLILPFDHVWKYNASRTDLGTSWREVNYDDSTWNSGPGALGAETSNRAEPLRTRFPNVPNTAYFRTEFNVNPGLAPSSIQITHLIDDSAAFYLNGREIGRYNLAPGASYRTLALANHGDATLQSFTIAPEQLLPGLNHLAAEVHQVSTTSSDIVFGLRIDAIIVTATPVQSGILINEVLAQNASFTEPDGSKPDWVELCNPSNESIDISGMSLTDDVANPQRWVFPSGSLIKGQGFASIQCNSEAPASDANTGFGLKANGGAVYLFNRKADGGSLQSSVTYGLQAADWSIGRVPDGGLDWRLTIPTFGTQNTAATLGNPHALTINEWMVDPVAGGDWFEIFNPSPEPVEISRLWLSDSLSSVTKHPLPPLSFIGQGAHAFQKFVADENLAQGADHVDFKLSASGEALAVSAVNGALIDGLSFGPQLKGISQGRLPDGSASLVDFTATATPGGSNFLPLENIFVNEVLSHSDPPLEDALELHNPTANAVDISGWYLSDSAQDLQKYLIPANTIVPAGGYQVLYEAEFNGDTAGERFSFSSARGDEIYLSQTINGVLTGYRAHASFGPSENGVSFGRFPTSQGVHFVPLIRRTFGQDNPATVFEFRTGAGAPNSTATVGPVVINEIMYQPPDGADTLEFIELHNNGPVARPLFDEAHPANAWRLRGGVNFEFPPGTVIPWGGYLVVVGFDPQTDIASLAAFQAAHQTASPIMGPFRGRLNNGGETIELQRPDSPQTIPGPDLGFVPYVVVDRIDFSNTAPWPVSAAGGGDSLQKLASHFYGNDPVSWGAAAPNPGRSSSARSDDSDSDGLPDAWELSHGLNPNDAADAQLDIDRDGLSNLREFIAGTDPRSAASTLAARVGVSATGGIVLEFTAASGRAYHIEFRDAIGSGDWEKLLEVDPVDSEQVLQFLITPSGASRFYRIAVSGRL